jgi:hypothetical protein
MENITESEYINEVSTLEKNSSKKKKLDSDSDSESTSNSDSISESTSTSDSESNSDSSDYDEDIRKLKEALNVSDSDDSDDSSEDSDDDGYVYTESSSEVRETKYARDAIFGNDVYKNKLFEHNFSAILDFLEFTKENRGVSQKHVDDIYNHYLANPDEFIKPLDIICYIQDDKDSDHFYIADGQHRFTALKKLYEVDGIDKHLLYFIHDAKNEEEIRKIIKNLNSSNPVTSIYSFEKIPDFIKKIGSKYTNIFSENKNHNNDKMNDIKLRDHIEEIKLFSRFELGVDEIYNYLLEFNQYAKEEFLARPNKIATDKKLFDRIASTHQFYGLIYRDYTWVNEFVNYIDKKRKNMVPVKSEEQQPAQPVELSPPSIDQMPAEELDDEPEKKETEQAKSEEQSKPEEKKEEEQPEIVD